MKIAAPWRSMAEMAAVRLSPEFRQPTAAEGISISARAFVQVREPAVVSQRWPVDRFCSATVRTVHPSATAMRYSDKHLVRA
jgi:hypothetical protein